MFGKKFGRFFGVHYWMDELEKLLKKNIDFKLINNLKNSSIFSSEQISLAFSRKENQDLNEIIEFR